SMRLEEWQASKRLAFCNPRLVAAADMAAHAMTKSSASTEAMPAPSPMTTPATRTTAPTLAAPRLWALESASFIFTTPAIPPASAVVAHSGAVPRTPSAPKKWRGYRAIERARHESLLRDALLGLVLLVLREIVLVLKCELVAIGVGLFSLKKALA